MASPLYGTIAPSLNDTKKIVLTRTLESMIQIASAFGGTVSNPLLGTSNPTLNDPELYLLIKLCEATNSLASAVSGGGSSGSYAAGGNFSGHGSPEGVQTANEGALYTDLDTDSIWVKHGNSSNTGWAV